MNLLGCLDTPTSGRYLLNGHDVSHLTDDALADIRNREIGFIFQTFQLLPRRGPALASVELPLVYRGMPAKKERRERARAALEKWPGRSNARTDPTSIVRRSAATRRHRAGARGRAVAAAGR